VIAAVRCRCAVRSVLFAILVAASGCSGPPPQPQMPPPSVEAMQPLRREVVDWDEYTARLEAVESVEIRPRVSGYLLSIRFQDGSAVRKGDLLFVIDPRPYEAALRRSEADLAAARSRHLLAQKNFARSADLIRSHAISQEEADIRESAVRQAAAQVSQAEAAVDAARLDVEFTQLTAPISGRIGRRLVTEGNLVNGGVGTQGTLLTTIVSLDPIYAYFEADERAYLKYTHMAETGERPSSREFNHPVFLGLADEAGFPREGRMNFVDNQFDPGTGTMVGRALVPNPDLLLSPGLFARLRLPASGRYDAVVIPDEAVGVDQQQRFVWLVAEGDRAERRNVVTGPLLDGARVVREGLGTDEWVIVAGTQRVRPGVAVQVKRLDNARLRPPPGQERAGARAVAAGGGHGESDVATKEDLKPKGPPR
jgi:multidrug efflux system membrane fusion protein